MSALDLAPPMPSPGCSAFVARRPPSPPLPTIVEFAPAITATVTPIDAAVSSSSGPAVARKRISSDVHTMVAKRPKLQPAVPPVSHDDEQGFLNVRIGSVLSDRYKVVAFIGKGTFARVYHCVDKQTTLPVAIKVIRNIKKYYDAALIEIAILTRIMECDPANNFNCVHLLNIFEFRHHICMVFPKLGLSLYDFLKSNRFRGFAVPHIKEFGRQLIRATKYLHDDLQIIHTDLKIENIMLIDSGHTSLSLDESCPSSFTLLPKSLGIRLIDFGSAVTTSASKPSLVSTRHYRAPEIVLGVPYTYAIDMWSIGCILYELFTGRLLFDTHEDGEHLKMMERVVGSFPVELSHGSFFKTDGSLVWDAKTASKESRDRVQKCSPISANLIDPDFCDLVTRLLCIDASKRLTAAAALQHAWLL